MFTLNLQLLLSTISFKIIFSHLLWANTRIGLGKEDEELKQEYSKFKAVDCLGTEGKLEAPERGKACA